jgi:hypothetical protein
MKRLLQALFSLTAKTLYGLALGFVASAFVLLWYELGERRLAEQSAAIAEVPSSGARTLQTRGPALTYEISAKDTQQSAIGSAWMRATEPSASPVASATAPDSHARKAEPSSKSPAPRPDPWRLPPVGRYIPRSGAEL